MRKQSNLELNVEILKRKKKTRVSYLYKDRLTINDNYLLLNKVGIIIYYNIYKGGK